ncbi:hypothetical protein N0V85_009588, partial [Neurospora sp. IMI 360204]
PGFGTGGRSGALCFGCLTLNPLATPMPSTLATSSGSAASSAPPSIGVCARLGARGGCCPKMGVMGGGLCEPNAVEGLVPMSVPVPSS